MLEAEATENEHIGPKNTLPVKSLVPMEVVTKPVPAIVIAVPLLTAPIALHRIVPKAPGTLTLHEMSLTA